MLYSGRSLEPKREGDPELHVDLDIWIVKRHQILLLNFQITLKIIYSC